LKSSGKKNIHTQCVEIRTRAGEVDERRVFAGLATSRAPIMFVQKAENGWRQKINGL